MVSLRPPVCALALVLVFSIAAVATAASIVPSNSTTGLRSYFGTITLQTQKGENVSDLIPLTRSTVASVRNSPLTGNLYYTTADSVGAISAQDVAYISCNPSDYPGNLGASAVFEQAYNNGNIIAAILYSTASDYCDYTDLTPSLQEFRIFSMTSKDVSRRLLNSVASLTAATTYAINIVRSDTNSSIGDGGNGQSNDTGNNQANPLGPSPSTAVAMVILYSITGIITALFLVIIITGAVRAHRHPDRYGPRDVLGRQRQSRARGIGRAILETIPIVKFGQTEPPKSTDVELGTAAERTAAETTAEPGTVTSQPETETRSADDTGVQRNAPLEQQSGIAAALPAASGALSLNDDSSEEALGCSICTDDFENGQDIRLLPCNHKFHPECVDPWLLNVSGTCPLCRVDLRPVDARNSIDDQDPDMLAPPLQPEMSMSHRRRSAFRDMLLLRSSPNASTEERISALRRLREQRRNGSGDLASGSANGSSDDVTAARRNRRISTRLSNVFSGRSRGATQDEPSNQHEPAVPAEASSSVAQSTPTAQNPPSTSINTEEASTAQRT
ncbi:hypothetical protein K504DRAFT_426656 [Pleomassaria siparia CBS 279.74]|uniref:RING-type domain-containing protein n=1 Tax=Pleomassaria siparia CBS 279.74 TaxID=1314801 RepID=A0A6G1KHT7_9PLEO|nr:hypothetical protein K504DRAFT_426656 [Pleomassaria siparia CBS 279.74]